MNDTKNTISSYLTIGISTVVVIIISHYIGSGYELLWPQVITGFGLISGVIAAVIILPIAWLMRWGYRRTILSLLVVAMIGMVVAIYRSQKDRGQTPRLEKIEPVISVND